MKKIILLVGFLAALTSGVKAQDPPWTRAEIRNMAKRAMNQDTAETSNITWSDEELNPLINEAIAYVSGLTKAVIRDTVIALIERQTVYGMPANYIQLVGSYTFWKGTESDKDRSPKGILEVMASMMGMEAGDAETQPRQLTDLGETERAVEITPRPQTKDSMRVLYIAYGRFLTADTGTIGTCDLPNKMQGCVVDRVCWQAWKKTRAANPYKADFAESISPFITDPKRTLLPPIKESEKPDAPR